MNTHQCLTRSKNALYLLSHIPAEELISGTWSDGKSKYCAIGHYERLTSTQPNDYSHFNCMDSEESLADVSRVFFQEKYAAPLSIVTINDAPHTLYPQPAIKDRVLTCLTDMVAFFEEKHPDSKSTTVRTD